MAVQCLRQQCLKQLGEGEVVVARSQVLRQLPLLLSSCRSSMRLCQERPCRVALPLVAVLQHRQQPELCQSLKNRLRAARLELRAGCAWGLQCVLLLLWPSGRQFVPPGATPGVCCLCVFVKWQVRLGWCVGCVCVWQCCPGLGVGVRAFGLQLQCKKIHVRCKG